MPLLPRTLAAPQPPAAVHCGNTQQDVGEQEAGQGKPPVLVVLSPVLGLACERYCDRTTLQVLAGGNMRSIFRGAADLKWIFSCERNQSERSQLVSEPTTSPRRRRKALPGECLEDGRLQPQPAACRNSSFYRERFG